MAHVTPKRLIARATHALARRFLIAPPRPTTRRVRAADFHLTVPPSVFHPRFFLSSEYFARHIGTLRLEEKRVADVGTGSGVLALAAARAGAATVLAVDINPAAARAACENAAANGYSGSIHAVCGDLLSCVSPDVRFDVILSNPPFFPGEPVDLADRAWHAGPKYRDIAGLFCQAYDRLAAGGEFLLVLSSNADLKEIEALYTRAGFTGLPVARRRLLFESLLIYSLRPNARRPTPV